MKYCVSCGKGHDDGAAFCGNCGHPLIRSGSAPIAAPAPASTQPRAPMPREPLSQPDRVAVAGFVLSLLSLLFYVSFPLSLVAFFLSLSASGAVRRKGLRIAALCISPVAILASVAYWLTYFNLI